MFFKQLTNMAVSSHQALAAAVIGCYGALVLVSIMRHSERSHCHHLTLRAAALLRDAAKSSLRADNGTVPTEVFVDATKASVYVSAVDKIMSPLEIANLTGIGVDELRAYTAAQVDEAYDNLSQAQKAPKREKTKYQPTISAFSVPPTPAWR